jgi:8-oxo-dGTP pyrophosphatase MutT (NUDIX family)
MILAGQWVTPGGGICTAVDSGKSAARTALRELRAK